MPKPLYLYLIFLSIGIAFLLAASIIAYFRFDFLKHSKKTDGTITDFILSTGKYRSFRPVVKYKTLTGKEQSFTNLVGSRPNPYKVGDHVPVFYDQANPSKAVIGTFFSLWLLPFIFGLIGTIFTIVGIVLRIFIA
ncbi:MAG: DUF3592 domain-containing protein [Candidatus Gracilibacteria bacterium]